MVVFLPAIVFLYHEMMFTQQHMLFSSLEAIDAQLQHFL